MNDAKLLYILNRLGLILINGKSEGSSGVLVFHHFLYDLKTTANTS